LDVYINELLTLALDGSEWSVSFPGRFRPEKTNIQKYIPYSLDMSLGGPEIKSMLSLERRNPCPCRISNSHSSVFHPVFQSHPLWGTPAPYWIQFGSLNYV